MNRVAATSTLDADWSVTTLTQRVRRVTDSPRNGSILYKLSSCGREKRARMDLPHPVPDGSECWDATDRIVVDLDAERPTRLAAQFSRTPPSYLDVLRDHGAAVAWDPAGTEFVSQYQDPDRLFVQHNQEGLAAPVVSLPVQGTVAADGVVATRQLTALVGGAATTTITLRLAWSALGSRLLLIVDPSTLPAERYKTVALRVGQSTEASNAANRDQDFTLEVSSGSRTAAIPVSSLHRLLYPDPPPFGPAKIVMQTLRLSVERLIECGVDPTDLRSIALVFDRRATGTVYVGDLQCSN